jgi:hypothetical protein
MAAIEISDAIARSTIDLSFLASIPDQFRQREVDDQTLHVAINSLDVLIKERLHFKDTAFAEHVK